MTKKAHKTKRLVSLLLAVFMVISVFAITAVPAGAAEDDVRATADGILNFGFLYNDIYLGGGSCFLINEDTILTANHCTRLTKLQYEYLKQQTGLTEEQINKGGSNAANDLGKGFTYKVTLARDFTIDATFVNSSENMDFAIMKLSQPIKNRTYLKLRDSNKVQAAETAWAVGFPSAKDSSSITYQYYNQRDISFERGTINRAQYTDTFPISTMFGSTITFSGDVLTVSGGTISGGNSGGPLEDADGNVIGICSASRADDKTCYATAISQVIEILDALGIKYTPAGDPTPDDKPTEASSSKVEETDPPKTDPVSSEITSSTSSDGSGGGSSSTIIIIAIVALVVILIAVVVIILVLNSKKKNGGKGGPSGGAPTGGPVMPPTAPTAPQRPAAPPYAQPYSRPQMPQGGAPTMPSNEGAGETSVLNEGAGETTVLGGQATGFALIRKSNTEKININKPEFVIGKEKRRVDYCIEGNNSVSRTHAKLRVRSGVCYISDLGSTNCTYVNGSKLAPNQEVALKSGDKIKISDEEFDFIG